MTEVVHRYCNEAITSQININIFVACFITCRVHLKLYEALKQLGQVLYFDTDLVIYHWKTTAPELTLGKYLGQFTN